MDVQAFSHTDPITMPTWGTSDYTPGGSVQIQPAASSLTATAEPLVCLSIETNTWGVELLFRMGEEALDDMDAPPPLPSTHFTRSEWIALTQAGLDVFDRLDT